MCVERGSPAAAPREVTANVPWRSYVFQSQARLLRRLRLVDALRLLRLRGAVHRFALARVAARRAREVADAAPRAGGRARAPARAFPVLREASQTQPTTAPHTREALRRGRRRR